jgi:transcription-repair coupling factor (superfamily II helicase)
VRFAPVELPESGRIRLSRLYPRSIVKDNLRTILVPRPSTAPVGGQPLRDEALLDWVREVVDSVIDRPAAPAAAS